MRSLNLGGSIRSSGSNRSIRARGRSRPHARALACAAVAVLSAVTLVGCGPEQLQPAPTYSPPPPPPPTPEELRHEAAEAWVDGATTRELVGSVMVSSVPSTDPAQLHALMVDTSLGGFILMGSNIPGTPEELRQLSEALTVDPERPPLVAIDEEGGTVKRLPWDEIAGADTLRRASEADVAAAFSSRAQLLADAGVSVNFGIVADETSDPQSFIYPRTFGDDPQSAAARVAAAVKGERGTVLSTLKHFPGHGAAPGDSHTSIPQTDLTLAQWRSAESLPFEAGIDAGAELLMFGHLSYSAVTPTPASLASEWYGIARDELGFTGVAVTDDLGMLQATGLPEYQDPAANVVSALSAGADLALLICNDAAEVGSVVDQVAAAVDRGELPAERLHEAAVRVAELRLLLAEQAAE